MAAKGSKIRAGMMLSEFIRKISQEETEFVKGESGDDKMATKAEALARVVWDMALGWVEEVDVFKDGAKVGVAKKKHPPAQWAINLVYDRAEGKAAQAGDTGEKKSDVSDRISQRTKDRVNKLAEATGNAGTSTVKPPPPQRVIPRHPARMERPDHGAQGSQEGCKPALGLAKESPEGGIE
jgi:hypothetical protein